MSTQPTAQDVQRQRLLQASAGRAVPAVAVLAAVLVLLVVLTLLVCGVLALLHRCVAAACSARPQEDGGGRRSSGSPS